MGVNTIIKMSSTKRPQCTVYTDRRPDERPKRSDFHCRCGIHNRDKKRILWKQGIHKSNKSIKNKKK